MVLRESIPHAPGSAGLIVFIVFGLLLACSRARALDPEKSISHFNCSSWTRESGLPGNKITSITQTADGTVWLGGQNGLIRFDGIEFTLVSLPLDLARTQEIRKLARSAKGGLWFATNNGGFGYFDGHDCKPLDDARWNQPRVFAATILESTDGAVWTGMQPGCGRWVAGQPAESFVEGIETTATTLAICEDSSGRIWRSTGTEGVYRFDKGRWIELSDPELKKYNIFALAADTHGQLWVGTERGLRCYDSSGVQQAIPPIDGDVKAILVDRHGVVWVGLYGGGVARLTDNAWSFLKKDHGLASDYITALYEDVEGSIWVGTRDGLSQITDLKFPILSDESGLPPGPSHSVTNAHDGGVWVMSYGLGHLNGRSARTYLPELSSINPFFINGYEARDGRLYLIDGDKSIVVFSQDKITTKIHAPTWPRVFAEDDQSMIVALGASLSRIIDGQLQPYLFRGPSPEFYWIYNLSVARDGALWVSSDHGVFRVKDDVFQHWSAADGLPGERINWAREDIDGSVWVGLGTGMARIKDGHVAKLTEENGLFDNRIYAIVPDDVGYLWISSGGGIFRASRVDLNAVADGKRRTLTCDVYDGLNSVKFSDRTDEEPSGCKTPDGRIWFPNSHGVVVIEPRKFVVNQSAPSVHIDRIELDGNDLKTTDHVRLEPGDHRISITFAALSYISPKRMRVRYQLEGADHDWIEVGQRRVATFANLKPGHYVFHVQAANADGVWNLTGAQFAFEQTPRFRETGWFILLCSCAGMFVVAAGYGWKARHMRATQLKLQAQNDLLEAKVAARTAELAREHALLRTLLDNSPDRIYFKDARSCYLKASQALADACGVKTPDDLIGKSDFDFFLDDHARPAFEDEQAIMRTGQPILGKVVREVRRDGTVSWVLTSKMALRNSANEIVGTFGTSKDITAIKEAEAQLEQVHKELLDSSRRAGMAEVATSVLHNVGNVLNSVNVSVTVVGEQLRRSKIPNLAKVSTMLEEHKSDLGTFLTQDPRGHQLPSYLRGLSEQLIAEQTRALEELGSLAKNVEHIKDIVATQQAYGKVSGVTETLSLADVANDAVRMYEAVAESGDVSLICEYTARPTLTVDKHKLLQILVNLLKNAHDACAESAKADKRIVLGITESPGRVIIKVRDNGVGIAPENLTRIFSHGFTTRKDGHGFGLHSGALAAKQMGGSLLAFSDGPGQGATFVLDLPIQPAGTAT